MELTPFLPSVNTGDRERPKTHILSFRSPSLSNSQGKPRWHGPGDRVRFEMEVQYSGEAADFPFTPSVHTNLDAKAGAWRTLPMSLISQSADRLRFALDVPVQSTAFSSATGVLLTKDELPYAWASQSGIGDVRFKPYDVAHDAKSIHLVSLANIGPEGRIGTLEDMLGDGAPSKLGHEGQYTLKYLKGLGHSAVRLLPIQPRVDSPYSATSLFDVWIEHSEPAKRLRAQLESLRAAPNHDPNRAQRLEAAIHEAAMGSLQRLIDEAHALGMEVIMDTVRNHVGPELSAFDAFFLDERGQTIDVFDTDKRAVSWEIRENDVSQLALGPEHQDWMEAQIQQAHEEGRKPALQDVSPHIFGKFGDNRGARNREEIADGGWIEWKKPGTWQLNHGTQRWGYRFYDVAQSEESRIARGYLMRELALYLMMGVDGLRLDHGTGMPQIFYDEDLRALQKLIDTYRPGARILIDTEDFHLHDKTIPGSDTVEMGGEKALINAVGPDQLRAAFDAPWRQNTVTSLGNHDEGSAIAHFGGHWPAYARLGVLTAALGGPDMLKQGDQRGELQAIDFRGSGAKMMTLQEGFHTSETQEMERLLGRARRAKRNLPALSQRGRDWLKRADGSWDGSVLAAARFTDDPKVVPEQPLALVFSNLSADFEANGSFELTSRAKDAIDPEAEYMAYNHMALDKYRAVWPEPVRGQSLLDDGVFVLLSPNETQILDIHEVQPDGSARGWRSKVSSKRAASKPVDAATRVRQLDEVFADLGLR